MQYPVIVPAYFCSRPNRFVAIVQLDDQETPVHVKNTGRCRELLVPGATVYLADAGANHGKRKYRYDLVAVEKGDRLINMDAQAPNQVAKEALEQGCLLLPGLSPLTQIRPETRYGASRFDFYLEDEKGTRGFLEVKGVTLEENGVAMFPDAPTQRGVRHLQELVQAKLAGFHAYVLFVIQMAGMRCFVPNDVTHPAFGDMLRQAERQGVSLLAYGCQVAPDRLELAQAVPIHLT